MTRFDTTPRTPVGAWNDLVDFLEKWEPSTIDVTVETFDEIIPELDDYPVDEEEPVDITF